jgi:Fe-S-cluster containining protein
MGKEKYKRKKEDTPASVKIIHQIKRLNNRKIDELFHSEHTSIFKKYDCLKCANCCKTTSPIFRKVDIDRISKSLGMKSIEFEKQYLKIDEEDDYVLKESPCSFLNSDNTCSIYEVRPLACKEYPHTDRKNMYQILDLTIKNTLVCPAVEEIVTSIGLKNNLSK